MMIDTYRAIGHNFAKIDPLYLPQNKDLFGRPAENSLEASQFGYQKEQMQETIVVKNLRGEGDKKDNGPYTIQEF